MDETKPTDVKIVEAKIAEVPVEVKPVTRLAVDTAEKFKAKVESWWSLVNTPSGAAGSLGVGGLLLSVWMLLSSYLSGEKKIGDLVKDVQIHVVIDDIKKPVHVTDVVAPPDPIPLPKPANVKPLIVIAIGMQLDQPYIDSLKAAGHTVSHHDALPGGWESIVKTYGQPPAIYIANKDGVVARAVDKAAMEPLIKQWSK